MRIWAGPVTRESLHVEDVTAGYGKVIAINRVNLECEPGTITCLLGRNGAGKSTLLLTIMGLVEARSGRIRLGSRILSRRFGWDRVPAGVAMVPEASGLIPNMTVSDNLRLGAYARRLPNRDFDRELDESLALFPVLRDRLSSPASTLSGGERQMAAIARALLAKPAFLILDEPSFGLAPIVVRDLFKLVAKLRDAGMGVLVAEQNSVAVLQVANRACVLDRGHVVEEGAADDIRDSAVAKRALFA